jgi:hypothetical protein
LHMPGQQSDRSNQMQSDAIRHHPKQSEANTHRR